MNKLSLVPIPRAENITARDFQTLYMEPLRILQALAVFYIQDRRWDRATSYAREMLRLQSNNEWVRRAMQQIQRRTIP